MQWPSRNLLYTGINDFSVEPPSARKAWRPSPPYNLPVGLQGLDRYVSRVISIVHLFTGWIQPMTALINMHSSGEITYSTNEPLPFGRDIDVSTVVVGCPPTGAAGAG
jgi:hypothetical protein